MSVAVKTICCIGAGYVGGPTMAVIADKCRDLKVMYDAGNIGPSYQPGHSHAQSLSFELSYKGKKVFVNSGISEYENSKIRSFQRSTASHNTIEINGMNSSDVWHSFRVAKRAKVYDRCC